MKQAKMTVVCLEMLRHRCVGSCRAVEKTQRHLKNEFSLWGCRGSSLRTETLSLCPGHIYFSLYLQFSQLISISLKHPERISPKYNAKYKLLNSSDTTVFQVF